MDRHIYLEYYHTDPDASIEIIADSGHAQFVEKTVMVYERIRTFLTHDKRDR